MSSYRLRATTRNDAQAVVDIVCGLEGAILGHADYSLADLEMEWRTVAVEEDTWVVVQGSSAEQIVGYGTIEARGDHFVTDGYVHPDHWGTGVGALLVSSLEDEARRRGATRVRNAVLERDSRAHDLLQAHGYREVRRFWQMRLDLTEEPAAPNWPGDVTVGSLDPAEAEQFHAALLAAFADHWGHAPEPFSAFVTEYLEHEDFDPELCAVVKADGEIVAGTVCLRERHGAGWIARLFTVRERRGAGIGAALLADAFGRLWRIGQRTVGLGVDAQSNTGANRLYERAGMHVHWGAVIFEKELA